MVRDNVPPSLPQDIQKQARGPSVPKKLSIGIVTSTFPFGFGEEFLRAELIALTKLGCDLTLIPAAPRSKRNTHQDLNVEVVRLAVLGLRTFYQAVKGFRSNVQGATRAVRLILQARSNFRTKLKNLALLPTGLAVADELSKRQVDHIHAYWLTGPSTVALIASQVTGITWSFTAHSGDIFLEQNLITEKTVLAKFGRVISSIAKREILRQSSSARADRLEVIHLGVAVSKRASSLDSQTGAHQIRLLCPAYFELCKGHGYLFAALRRLADTGVDFHCVLAGDGPLRSQLVGQIKALRLGRFVSMVGMIPHETLLDQLHSGAYDVVVLASIDLEGIPVSLIEAMAAGIPCVATRTGAIAELIDSSCGILLEQRDPYAMSEAIAALASDAALRKEIGERARQRVTASFDAGDSARALLKLITSKETQYST